MPASKLRFVFAGTPDFAARHLAHLLQQGHHVVSAYSQPDRPSGRGKKLAPTPVKALAESHGIPVRQPPALDQPALAELAALKPDLIIVVAYGLLLPPAALALPRLGCINVHASLLPRWRGAAPIERAILEGDRETGISIMQMDAGLDTGAVLATAATPISASDNSETLTERLVSFGCETLSAVLDQLAAGTAKAVPQNATLATYARKLRKDDAGIIWEGSAAYIHNQVRALYPRSPAYCLYQGQRLRILHTRMIPGVLSAKPGTIIEMAEDVMAVACGDGALEIRLIQMEGKTPMTLRELLNGRPGYFKPGTLLLSASQHAPE